MKNIIEVTQENTISCDNFKCNFTVKNVNANQPADLLEYVNKPCPKCQENLLTEKDYNTWRKTIKVINWINRWFSWLTIFSRSNKSKSVIVKVHNGLNIIEDEENTTNSTD